MALPFAQSTGTYAQEGCLRKDSRWLLYVSRRWTPKDTHKSLQAATKHTIWLLGGL